MHTNATEKAQRLIDNIERVVFGKYDVVKLCVVGLIARGHLLIEDVPGIGKTTIAQALARSLDCRLFSCVNNVCSSGVGWAVSTDMAVALRLSAGSIW